MRALAIALAVVAGAACHVVPPAAPGPAPIGACRFDLATLRFAGDAIAQARCLLRPISTGGVLRPDPADLPPAFVGLIDRPTGALRARLVDWLARRGAAAAEVGGPLDAPVSRANDGDPRAPAARYFVIHDTSTPWLGDAPAFPPDDDPRVNDVEQFAGPEAVAHVFVARDGHVLLGHDFSVPWRATKLESKRIGIPAKGLFLHVELMQPRRRDPAGGPRDDRLAPMPGFTVAQYARLAVLYAAASARAGRWLIPAFHAAIDEGLPDAHDDPQHFDMAEFDHALAALLAALGVAP